MRWPAASRRASSSTRSAVSRTSSGASSTPSGRTAFARTRCASSAGSGCSRSSRSPSRPTRSRRCAPRRRGSATSRRERIGGGLEADGMGELSKLLLGARPAEALRLARDTGVLVEVIPEFGPVIGYDLGSPRQPGSLDEHLFDVVQQTAVLDAELSVRLCALLHDLGKPEAGAGRAAPTTHRSAPGIAGRVLRRLRYPNRPPRRGPPPRRRPRVLTRRPDRRRPRPALPRLARARARAPPRAPQARRPDREARRAVGARPPRGARAARSRRSATARTVSPTWSVDGSDLIEPRLPRRPGDRRGARAAARPRRRRSGGERSRGTCSTEAGRWRR